MSPHSVRPSIIAIDDSEVIQKLLAAQLASEQVDVHCAGTGEDGLALARALRPDLILLDVDLPDMDGFEACRRLKRDPMTRDVPVVFLTGSDDKLTIIRGLDAGAVDCIVKPFDGAELRARVRAALRTKRCHDRLAMHSMLDPTTGLWNRAYFAQRLHDEVHAAARYGRRVSLLFVDIDGFQSVNDTHGPLAGDELVKLVGAALMRITRSTDAPCRLGSDAFGIILTETPLAGAQRVAERVLDEVGGIRLIIGGAALRVAVSVGVASTEQLPRVGDDAGEVLVARADEALRQAKRAGKNRLCVAPD